MSRVSLVSSGGARVGSILTPSTGAPNGGQRFPGPRGGVWASESVRGGIMTRFVDSEGREYVTSWDAAVSAARDWADGGDGWDLEALACILYEGAHFLPGAVRWYERASVDLEAAAACDYRTWRRAAVCDCRLGMVAERWDLSGAGLICHIALWIDCGEPSLVVSTVPYWGASPWRSGFQTVGDSDHPASWGRLDRALGGRDAWRRELADAAARFIGD